jgi:hypothetical protein
MNYQYAFSRCLNLFQTPALINIIGFPLEIDYKRIHFYQYTPLMSAHVKYSMVFVLGHTSAAQQINTANDFISALDI